jgi:hypothetical protein
MIQVFVLQNEIFVLLDIDNSPFLVSIDPIMCIIKCHLLSFSSLKTAFNIENILKYNILISEEKLELNDHRVVTDKDVSLLANQIILKNKFASSGVFIKQNINK